MKTQKTLNALIICAFLLLVSSAMAQTIITIDNNPGSTTTYQTLQDAHDNATAGDIIYVQPSGTSYGTVTIDKSLSIVGRSHSEPGKISEIGSVNLRASNITLKGLSISNINTSSSASAPTPPPYSGINIFECKFSSLTIGETNTEGTTTVDNVAIRGNVITSSINVYNDGNDVLISNNILTSSSPLSIYNVATTVVSNNIFKYQSGAINLYNYANSGTLLLFNNMFIFNYGADAYVRLNYGDFNLSNNLTFNYNGDNIVNFQSQSGGTYIENNTLANTDPLFTNVDASVNQSFAGSSNYDPITRLEDDLTLQTGSPALTGGGGGSQIGLFNNSFLYKKLGNPRGVPTLDVISYDGAVPKNGNINVTINAKAH